MPAFGLKLFKSFRIPAYVLFFGAKRDFQGIRLIMTASGAIRPAGSARKADMATTGFASPAPRRAGRDPQDEIALIERVCAGEKHLFYELIQPYERSEYIAAHSVLQNEADAEEVAQEAFLKAFGNLASFRKESKFSTWLIQISINEARMKRRKDRKP